MADYTQTQDPPADSTVAPATSSSQASADLSTETKVKEQVQENSQTPIPAESPTQSSVDPVFVEPAQANSSPPAAPPSDIPPDTSIPSVPSEPSAPSPSPEANFRDIIKEPLPPDQPSQAQPEVPRSAPSVSGSESNNTAPQSAEIKPEPLEGTQNTSSADLPSEASAKLGLNSQKSSFGDILYGTPKATLPTSSSPEPAQRPAPVSSPSVPKTSFGDLLGKSPYVEPTINIEPIEAPKETTPPPASTPSPLSADLSAEASAKVEAKEGQLAQSSRQKSLQVRKQKHDANIAEILKLLAKKSKIQNIDVRDYLHVSQSTATDYLHTLVNSGKIKKEGKGKATVYML